MEEVICTSCKGQKGWCEGGNWGDCAKCNGKGFIKNEIPNQYFKVKCPRCNRTIAYVGKPNSPPSCRCGYSVPKIVSEYDSSLDIAENKHD